MLAAGSMAQAKTTVITENFQIVDKTEKTGEAVKAAGSQVLGELADYSVVSGERTPGNIAFVKQTQGKNYVIKDSITIVCKKDVNCVSEDREAVDLGHNFYKIKVKDYEDWKSVIEQYKNNPNVKKVAPSYYFGAKPRLK